MIVIDVGSLVLLFFICYVLVFIEDINDNSLEILFFNNENYIIFFFYDILINSVVGRVCVVDIDYGLNFVFSYFFIGSDIFSIYVDKGDIYVIR